MENLIKNIKQLEITEIEHHVNNENGGTYLSVHTNMGGTVHIDTLDTCSLDDLKYVVDRLDVDLINVDELIESMDFKKSLRWFIFEHIKKKIKEVNNDW